MQGCAGETEWGTDRYEQTQDWCVQLGGGGGTRLPSFACAGMNRAYGGMCVGCRTSMGVHRGGDRCVLAAGTQGDRSGERYKYEAHVGVEQV